MVTLPVSPQVQTYQTSPIALTRRPVASKLEEFGRSFCEAVDLAETMAAEDEAAPHNVQTWLFAAQQLLPLFTALNLPLPLILPLQNGGVGVEWHECGLNIELRFRSPYQVYAVLEDAQGLVPTLHNYDHNLVHAHAALRELSVRTTI